ncbi:Glycolipid 2-alpha-mannosyltransferase [Nakaseomyces bracarensis]|uniref:Glycolipid 2-alpha-mannosyltransferase n=1 Tax=Nakaseomyces bracarensis TaxID=273131 RepID=A0ABR4NYC7_9SACH
MAIFLSRRLIRTLVFSVISLVILLALLNSHKSTAAYVPTPFRVVNVGSFGMGYGSSATDEEIDELVSDNLTTLDKEAEETRKKAEKAAAAGEKKDPNEETEGSKALEEAAVDAAGKPVEMSLMDFLKPTFAKAGSKPKAAFVTLARNSNLQGLIGSIKKMESRFNHKYNYPWVFLNEVEFSDEFKNTVKSLCSGPVSFGLIPEEQWSYPEWVDLDEAAAGRKKLADNNVIYGDSESYRHMCRYQSGFFWRHPLLDDYDWYWRVEPDTRITCDIPYDPFQYMQDNQKAYGFTITIHEYEATIKTLWKTTKDFLKGHKDYIVEDNLSKFISEDDLETYNLCHFWSNFEIASLNLWRSPQYKAYFEYLDKSGNFFYERWGDAPVHSIAAALFLPRSAIHYFNDIGYYHPPYHNCPIDADLHAERNCECEAKSDFTFRGYACGRQYFDAQKLERPANWKEYSN